MIQMRESFFPFAALTDAGLVRQKNEDRFAITAFRSDAAPSIPGLLAVLCDGVGGESAGEIAAELAVDSITHFVLSNPGEDDPLKVLPSAVLKANEAILDQVREHPNMTGMAATAACVWISGRKLSIATLGDSRIYLIRGNQITQLSTDHTWVQEALETGVITEDEKENHPNAHVIRRFLGSDAPPEADLHINFPNGRSETQLELHPWDIVFMCSDGCSDLVTPEEIRNGFAGRKLAKSLAEIKQLAFERGGRDNITMIAVQIPNKMPGVLPRKRTWRWILIGLAVLLAIGAGLYFGWWFQNLNREGSLAAFTPQQFSSTLAPAPSTPAPTVTPLGSLAPGSFVESTECG